MTDGVGVLSKFHDSLQDAVCVFDADGVLVDANARVGEVSGLPTADLLGVAHQELLDDYGADGTVDDG